MTRLEQAGEPSMEDILASIRKIIAEDPPGSRDLPEVRAEPAAPSVTDRIFQRMGDAVRSEQAKPAAANEPYLRSTMPSLSSAPSAAPSIEAGKPFDIDAQMAEVLSKTRGGTPRRDVEPSFGPTLPEVQAALDSLSLTSNVTATPAPPSRPGFTVARDGFVPDAPIHSPVNVQMSAPMGSPMTAPVKSAANDPFEFSLGPSPFASRSAPPPALDTSMPEVRDTRYQDFGTLVPTRPFAGESEAAEAPVAGPAAAPVTADAAAQVDEPNIDEPNIDKNNVDESDVSAAIAPGDGENQATSEAASAGAKPTEAAERDTPSPEAVAAQLKDFETAIRSSDAAPAAQVKSVESVLASLKWELGQAEPVETTSLRPDPEPQTASAAASELLAAIEPEIAAPVAVAPLAVAVAPEPERVTLAPVEIEDAAAAHVAAESMFDHPMADIVAIEEPAPIEAPAMMQEMVIAEPISESMRASASLPSPFHVLQSSGMQSAIMPGSRSMEDTVAELLRPMLRNWLAENMPKIVERALRKEIDDSLHSEHKTAAE